MRVILIPGMGCTPIEHCNWYAWFRDEMKHRPNVECTLHPFPDPHQCRESIWLPHVQSLIRQHPTTAPATLCTDPTTDAARFADTIVIGHSSGAACAMRLLEQCARDATPVAGCILVAAAWTDLGDATERASEYFNRPWKWTTMAQGVVVSSPRRIVLFHGSDDDVIPVDEARTIAGHLKDAVDYRERPNQSHFFRPFPELLQVVDDMLNHRD